MQSSGPLARRQSQGHTWLHGSLGDVASQVLCPGRRGGKCLKTASQGLLLTFIWGGEVGAWSEPEPWG